MFKRNNGCVRGCARRPRMARAIGCVMEQMENRQLLSAGVLDSSFGSGGIARVGLTSQALDRAGAATVFNGDLIVAGTSDNRIAIAKYTNGIPTTQTIVLPNLGSVTQINGITSDGSGLLLTGSANVGDHSAIVVVRLNANLTADTNFGPTHRGYAVIDTGINTSAAGIAVSGGNILVAGTVDPGNGDSDILLAGVHADGSAWNEVQQQLDPGDTDTAAGIAVDSQGRAVVVGTSVQGGNGQIFVARFDAAGALDSGFGPQFLAPGGNDFAAAVAILPGDRVLVAGTSSAGLNDDVELIAYTSQGVLDGSFGTNGVATYSQPGDAINARAMSVDPLSGDVVVAAADPTAGAPLVARYSADTGWSAQSVVEMAGASVAAVSAEAGTQLVGTINQMAGGDFAVATVTGQGVDVEPAAFNGLQQVNVTAAAVGADGASVLAGDQSTSVVIAKVNPDGTPAWTTPVAVPGTAFVAMTAVTELADGSVVALGTSTDGDGTHILLVHVTSAGAVDWVQVDARANIAQPYSLAVMANGDYLVGGANDTYDSTLWRFDAAGNPATGFGDNGILVLPDLGGGFITALRATPTGVLVAAVDGNGVCLIDSLNDDGSVAASGSVELGSLWGGVTSIATNGTTIAVAGLSGDSQFVVATLDATLANPTIFTPFANVAGAQGSVAYSVAVDAQGRILAGGTLFQGDGTTDLAVARYLANGSLDFATVTNVSWLSPSQDNGLGVGVSADGTRLFLAGSSAQTFVVAGYTDSPLAPPVNQPPSAQLQWPPSADAGSTITLHATGSSDSDGSIVEYQWDLDGNGSFETTTTIDSVTFAAPAAPGSLVVGLRVKDNLGALSDGATGTITIVQLAPVPSINGLPAAPVEGSPISLTATATDSAADMIAGFTYAWSVTKNGSPFASGSGPAIAFTPDDNGSYVVSLSATDQGNHTGTTSATLNVQNVAPTVSLTAPATGVSQNAVSLSGSFTDPGTQDNVTLSWVIKRGTTVVATGTGAAFSFTPSQPGAYTVILTATDKDGASATANATVNVTQAAVAGGVLTVGGTSGSDDLVIRSPQAGVIRVLSGGVIVGNFTGVNSIVVRGGPGDDSITLNAGLGVSAIVYGDDGDDKLVTGNGGDLLFGGAGDDTLKGRDGADVLVGGDGDDLLSGGDGNDLVIGGMGADRIMGDSNDDILIAGPTAYDNNLTALRAISAEWSSPRLYYLRVANIWNGTGGSRLNGNYFLTPDVTVFDDGARDVLSGDQGVDWFIFNADNGVRDKVTDLAFWEVASDIDVLASLA